MINAKQVERSVIGIRSRIGANSIVTNTYMMGSDRYESMKELSTEGHVAMGIGYNCTIDNAILDKNCRIGDGVTIKGGKHLEDADTESYAIKDGIVVVKKDATIPPGFTI
jgi:glucose-1-phosphate adenylyltransferase